MKKNLGPQKIFQLSDIEYEKIRYLRQSDVFPTPFFSPGLMFGPHYLTTPVFSHVLFSVCDDLRG